MDSTIAQLRKGTIELAILALLNRGKKYGGEIIDVLSQAKGLNAPAGTVYPLLKRLASAGAVSTSWQESPSGPPRKYYAITDAGRRHLSALTSAWHELSNSLNTLMEG